MKMKKVPAISEEYSAIGFGCWAISGSDVWNNTTDHDSIEAIHAALDLGVNFFDVAPVYGLGHAETVLGQALEGKRDQVYIASKCGLVWDAQKNVTVNLTRNSLFQEIDASLQRLQTDHIDIYQMHWPDPQTPIQETMEALVDIQNTGKIRYIGVSNFSLALTQEAMKYGEVVSYQGLYNLLEQNPTTYHAIDLDYRTQDEILPLCRDKGLAYLPYSPLFQGLLTGSFSQSNNFDDNDVRSENPKLSGPRLGQYLEIVKQLKTFAQSIDKPLTQIALNWLIAEEAIPTVICGAQNPSHVEQNVASTTWELTNDMIAEIDQIVAPYKTSGLV